VGEVVAGDPDDLLAAEAGLNAEPIRDLLLERLRLVDERCDLVVLVVLAEPDPLSVSFGVVVKSYSRFFEVTLLILTAEYLSNRSTLLRYGFPRQRVYRRPPPG